MPRTELDEMRERVARYEAMLRRITDIYAVEALTAIVARLRKQIAALEADNEERSGRL